MALESVPYAARLEIDYPERLDRLTTFLRVFYLIPILIVFGLSTTGDGKGGGAMAGLAAATALMIVFRQRYPRWWFDFAREGARFGARVGAYFLLMTDKYPSTVDEQSVHLEIDYPDAERDLNRWLPLVKWMLAIPHYIVLTLLVVAAIGAVVVAWFAILFTERYPKGIFDFVVGVSRWMLRVQAYAFLLVTDRYPPFSMS